MPTYAIGDVQGCYAELRELLDVIRFEPARDRLWFVGDLVNRGPQSLETLRFVRSLGPAAVTVLGNHDLHLLAIACGGRNAQDRLRPDDTLEAILRASDRDELMDWLRRLPLFHHDDALGYTMVHAGFPPQWDVNTTRDCAAEVERALSDDDGTRELFAHMYGNQPDRWSDALQGTDRLRFIVNCLTRLRVCTLDGRLDLKYKGTLEKIPAAFYPWFRVPNRRSADLRIVCGHWSALDFYDGDGILAIDTGCVWGERLCAVRLDAVADPMFVRSRQPKRLGE